MRDKARTSVDYAGFSIDVIVSLQRLIPVVDSWATARLDVGEIEQMGAHIHLSECSTTPNGVEDRLQTAPPALKLTENEFDVVVIPFVSQRPLQHHES